MTVFRLAAISAIYLIALASFGWGLAAAQFKIFPWHYIELTYGFFRGGDNEVSSLVQKVVNDLGIFPERHVRKYVPADADRFREVALNDIHDRREPPRLWISPDAQRSYRLIVGAFDFDDAFWGAILLDPSGQVVHRWRMNAEIAELTDKQDVLKNLYGVAFFPDGSAVFTMQEEGGGLVKIDSCSRVAWTKKGLFHHAISPTADYAAFWALGGGQGALHPDLLLIDAKDGRTIRKIDMAEVEKANAGTFIFDLQHGSDENHATHPNDIEPLPPSLAEAFPGFEAGDLLLSYRTTNLIFVVDPDTLKIKWWYIGAADGQHDPDWQKDGTISVFNNNFRHERRGGRWGAVQRSTIVSIDPETNTHRTVLDGADYNFFSVVNGNHHFTDYGSVIIASSRQGRVFEVDLTNGRKISDFVNTYNWKDGRTLHVSEAITVDREQVERWASRGCPMLSAQKGG